MFTKKILIILFIAVAFVGIGTYFLQKRFFIPIYNCRETYSFESKSSGHWGTEKCNHVNTYNCKSTNGCDNYVFLDEYYQKSLWHYLLVFDGKRFYLKNFLTGKEKIFNNKEKNYNKENLKLSNLNYVINNKKVIGFINSSSKMKGYYSFDLGLVLKDYNKIYCNDYESTTTDECNNLLVTVKKLNASVEEVGLFNLSTNDFLKKVNVSINEDFYNDEIFEFYKINNNYILYHNYIVNNSAQYSLDIYNSESNLISNDIKYNIFDNNRLIFTTDYKTLKTYDVNTNQFLKTTDYNNIITFNKEVIAVVDSDNYVKIVDYNKKILKIIVKLTDGIIIDNDASYYSPEIKSLIIMLRDYNNPLTNIGLQYSNIEYRYNYVTGEINSF